MLIGRGRYNWMEGADDKRPTNVRRIRRDIGITARKIITVRVLNSLHRYLTRSVWPGRRRVYADGLRAAFARHLGTKPMFIAKLSEAREK